MLNDLYHVSWILKFKSKWLYWCLWESTYRGRDKASIDSKLHKFSTHFLYFASPRKKKTYNFSFKKDFNLLDGHVVEYMFEGKSILRNWRKKKVKELPTKNSIKFYIFPLFPFLFFYKYNIHFLSGKESRIFICLLSGFSP